MRSLTLLIAGIGGPLAGAAEPEPTRPFAYLGSPAFRHAAGRLTLVGYSSDGTRLITQDWFGVHTWNADTGRHLRLHRRPLDPERLPYPDVISADGRLAAGWFPVTVRDVPTGRWLIPPGRFERMSWAPALDPTGRTLAYLHKPVKGGPIRVQLFDLKRGLPTHSWEAGHPKELDSEIRPAFSSDGAMILAPTWRDPKEGYASGFELREVYTGRVIAELIPDEERNPGFSTPEFSPDSRWAAAYSSWSDEVYLWDLRTGRSRRIGEAVSFAFTTDARRIAIDDGDGTVRVHELPSCSELVRWRVRPRGGGRVSAGSLAFRPDGKALARLERTAVRVWDPENGRELLPFVGHRTEVREVTFAPDGRLFSNAPDGIIEWDRRTGREVRHRPVDWVGGYGPKLSPDGERAVSRGEDKSVWLADESGDIRKMEWGGNTSPDLAWSADGSAFAAWDEDRIAVFDRDGDVLTRRHLRGTDGAVALSPGGRRVAVSRGDTVEVRDTATGRRLYRLGTLTGEAGELRFSPDGDRLAVVEWGHARVWSLAGPEAKQLLEFDCPPDLGGLAAPAFSSDGDRLAVIHSQGYLMPCHVWVWDVATRERVATFAAERDVPVHGLAFAPDGRILAGALSDGRVALWRLPEGEDK